MGDGAFTGGMIYEGMNNIRSLNNLIVVLNDNKMSISKNVGSVAQYLTQLRTSPRYFKAKRDVESLLDSTAGCGWRHQGRHPNGEICIPAFVVSFHNV